MANCKQVEITGAVSFNLIPRPSYDGAMVNRYRNYTPKWGHNYNFARDKLLMQIGIINMPLNGLTLDFSKIENSVGLFDFTLSGMESLPFSFFEEFCDNILAVGGAITYVYLYDIDGPEDLTHYFARQVTPPVANEE